MDVTMAVLLALVLGLLMVKFALFQQRNPHSPPCISGWIPWLGAAFQFGKAPLEFIEQARVKVRIIIGCMHLCVGGGGSWGSIGRQMRNLSALNESLPTLRRFLSFLL
ncbi:T-cell surface antigen CD2-like [Platysternon megacephalum]|uniref:T-cell surface antigen CD2-like n=1 Tax=Platysternon megacephalum TaxID=55544 RepID=A0A4D9EQZ6_9SAUR|nr:T-cell surface antigen CD2-like [Platysternon megacephalum]